MSMKKVCTKCNELKSTLNFYKDKRGKDGYYSKCKECHNATKKNKQEYRTHPSPQITARHIIAGVHNRINNNPRYKKISCDFTSAQLEDFLKNIWGDYMKLHTQWEQKKFDYKYTPSIDRIDSQGNYTLTNIQIITLSENSYRANKGRIHSLEDNKKKAVAIRAAHRANSRKYQWKGKEKTLSELADEIGASYSVLYMRIHVNGWTLERAMNKKIKQN